MRKDIDRTLRLPESLTWNEKQIAIEAARFLGFKSEWAQFPVVSNAYGIEIPSKLEMLSNICKNEDRKEGALPEEYVAATDSAKPVESFDWRQKKGLETIFGTGFLLKDYNLDLLPDEMDVQFVIPEDADWSTMAAACNVAFRLGMETTAYSGLLLVKQPSCANQIIFESAGKCSIRMEQKSGGVQIVIAGAGKELEDFSAYLCEHFPLQGDFETWTSYAQEMIDSLTMQNLDGQLAYTKAFAKEGAVVYADPQIENRSEKFKASFPDKEFVNFKSMKKKYEKEYELPWEVDMFKEVLETKLYPILREGDRVDISAALSEEKEERDQLSKEIAETLLAAGAQGEDISVICSYKQGFSWIDEVVIPAVKKAGKAEKVCIRFQPFLPAGETTWKDENGATPSYNNLGDDPDKWYDLPIRYVQELYPVEDLLSKRLGVLPGNIQLQVYEGEEDLTYEVEVLAQGDVSIYANSYKAACVERPYLDAYPQMGKVHPATGFVKVAVNGEVLIEERIETDVERIWDIYQKHVLADCRSYIEEKTNGTISLEEQPFFARLCIEIEASEPDFRLGSREDLFSTLDGLHEDIYFAGADYFKNYGMEKAGVMLDAPGLILPVIRKKAGPPRMKVTLYEQQAAKPWIKNGDEVIEAKGSRETVNVYMEELEFCEGEKIGTIRVEGADEKVTESYASLLSEGLLEMSEKLHGLTALRFRTDKDLYTAKVKESKEEKKDLDIRDIDILEEELIGYEQYRELIDKLKRVKGLHVYRTAVSYSGREVYAVEVLPKYEGYLSMTKRLTQYPSEIINARHHANEVSGTNAAFMLIRTLLSDPHYKEIPQKLSLVIVPMENVDGAAIHYELQKDNPYWKLHVARFNAIGKEFYHEHFKPDTIHTEAMALTRLFERFLPDVIVDNHGVPSHEWEQQFSGYTSPSYKGFWLPRSLLYGYFWSVNDEVYKGNYAVNKKMEDVIADALAEDEEMTGWNKAWAKQFEKFAHGWLPKLFPANYYKDMINYWIPFAYDSKHRYPSIRFPWITTAAYTSEVADETAQGEYLNLCARAHLKQDLAVLKMLAGSTCVYKDKWNITDDTVEAAHIRRRPVIV